MQSLLGDAIGGLVQTVGKVVNGLVVCKPLPYQANSAMIGPQGGTLQVGPHRIVFPAGALSRMTKITAEIPNDPVASVRFSPEGLKFPANARPALQVSYENCPLINLQALLPTKSIAYTTEKLSILERLRSFDNPLTRKVSAPLDHFSRYAVAW